MPNLNFKQEDIEEKGGLNTALEIEGQPALWQEVYDQMLLQKKSIRAFLAPFLTHSDGRIILTGAGSSAFIGGSSAGYHPGQYKKNNTRHRYHRPDHPSPAVFYKRNAHLTGVIRQVRQ